MHAPHFSNEDGETWITTGSAEELEEFIEGEGHI